MKPARHCFVSETGELLARWQEAFPKAVGIRFAAALPKPTPSLLWVRLQHDKSVAGQLAEVRRRFGNLPCVVMSDLPEDDQAIASFAAAARAYCNTHAAPAFLRQVAEVVGQGGLWIGESLMSRLVEATSRLEAKKNAVESTDSWAAPLTPREQEVARAIAEGASNKEIARGLGITERTVKLHVGAVLEKLGVRDRLQVALIVNGVRQSQPA